ncbi:NAD(P)-binding protein [Melanomma pulvis-pyrius CBS 109.77]|uniref:NAD(P)-binding protein n=1 Tax=Melanomma pulvis-pyrius CBS 109.77 TaxID=1314802 RepID=A0A6A6XRB2_9PLEO|nr:NAD(P)-binding protein [Melanomma pulvis-pyrius CBS 109.77]
MSTFNQIFPPCPTFTEKSLVDLSSKVYLVTGATSGIGLSLATLLYSLHATVYIGTRTLSQFTTANTAITSTHPSSKGSLRPFIADLSSLASLNPAITTLLATEYRLDVLFLNAGVMTPPENSKTSDGHDMEIGVNCLSSFLLVQKLSPLMSSVSSHFCHANTSVRIVWVSSLLNVSTPEGGVQFDSETGMPKQFKGMQNYMQSKAGAYLLAHEFSLRQKQLQPQISTQTPALPSRNPHGVLHVALNPGFLKTELQRHAPPPLRLVMGAMLKGPQYGAYTELYAGLAPDVQNGDFVIPWGRRGEVPGHIVESTRATEGEKSVSARFYEWCEEQVKPFM